MSNTPPQLEALSPDSQLRRVLESLGGYRQSQGDSSSWATIEPPLRELLTRIRSADAHSTRDLAEQLQAVHNVVSRKSSTDPHLTPVLRAYRIDGNHRGSSSGMEDKHMPLTDVIRNHITEYCFKHLNVKVGTEAPLDKNSPAAEDRPNE